MDSGPILPLVAEALKDIYARIDGISKNFTLLRQSLQEFQTAIGQKNMIIIENIKKLQSTLIELKDSDKLQTTIKTIHESIGDIRDGIWYLEFQKTLNRFIEKMEHI
jgi:CHAD domain-containing protein